MSAGTFVDRFLQAHGREVDRCKYNSRERNFPSINCVQNTPAGVPTDMCRVVIASPACMANFWPKRDSFYTLSMFACLGLHATNLHVKMVHCHANGVYSPARILTNHWLLHHIHVPTWLTSGYSFTREVGAMFGIYT